MQDVVHDSGTGTPPRPVSMTGTGRGTGSTSLLISIGYRARYARTLRSTFSYSWLRGSRPGPIAKAS